LAELLPALPALVGKMTLDKILSFIVAGAPLDVPPSTEASAGLTSIARAILALPDSRHRLRDVERAVVAHALASTKGNVSAAARLLGTDRKALERRVGKYKIARPR
jgi:DNA-binding NtrC family response regulator